MTRDWSASLADLLAYVRSRFPARLAVPLVVFLAAAGLATGPRPTPAPVLWTLALAAGLVFPFRLWDDLADLPRDRRRHPARVLCRVTRLGPFRGLLAVTALLAVGLLSLQAGAGHRVVALGLLGSGLAGWYGWLRDLWPHPLVGYHVVLAKYPVFVYLLSPEPAGASSGLSWRLGVAMVVVYLCLAIDEALHDPELAWTRAGSLLVAVEMAALVLISASVSAHAVGRALPTVALHGAGIAAGGGTLAWLHAERRSGGEPGSWRYLVFALGLVALLTLSPEVSP